MAIFFKSSLKDMVIDFRESRREREKEGDEGERDRCEIRRLIGCLQHAPQLGIDSATQVCTLTRN